MTEANHILLGVVASIVGAIVILGLLVGMGIVLKWIYVFREGIPLSLALAHAREGNGLFIINSTPTLPGVLWWWPSGGDPSSSGDFDLEVEAQCAMHVDEAKPVRVFRRKTADGLLGDPALAGRVIELEREALIDWEEDDEVEENDAL